MPKSYMNEAQIREGMETDQYCRFPRDSLANSPGRDPDLSRVENFLAHSPG
jgi:hypothetical protein